MVLPRGCAALPASLQLRQRRLGAAAGLGAPCPARGRRGARGYFPARGSLPGSGLPARTRGSRPGLPAAHSPGARGRGRSRNPRAVGTDEMRPRPRKQGIPNWQLAEPSLPLDEESSTFLTQIRDKAGI